MTIRTMEKAHQYLDTWVQNCQTPGEHRLDGEIACENLLPAVKALDDHDWGYLVAITGLDCDVEAGVIEVLYQFCAGSAVLTLRVTCSREQPVVPSIYSIIPYATVFERELREMFGVEVLDISDASPLYLPDDWTEGVYPLRKDVEGK